MAITKRTPIRRYSQSRTFNDGDLTVAAWRAYNCPSLCADLYNNNYGPGYDCLWRRQLNYRRLTLHGHFGGCFPSSRCNCYLTVVCTIIVENNKFPEDGEGGIGREQERERESERERERMKINHYAMHVFIKGSLNCN